MIDCDRVCKFLHDFDRQTYTTIRNLRDSSCGALADEYAMQRVEMFPEYVRTVLRDLNYFGDFAMKCGSSGETIVCDGVEFEREVHGWAYYNTKEN